VYLSSLVVEGDDRWLVAVVEDERGVEPRHQLKSGANPELMLQLQRLSLHSPQSSMWLTHLVSG